MAVGICLAATACAQQKTVQRQPYVSSKSPEELRQLREAFYNTDCTDKGLAQRRSQAANKDLFKALTDIPLQEAHAFMANYTRVSFYLGGSHGTQIEYTSEDGKAHLWYPGNDRILHGKWKVTREENQTLVCFAYGPGTSNPATGHVGDDFECGPLHTFRLTTVDSAKGDPFALASTDEIEHRLPKMAARPYMPNCQPFKQPHLTEGKTIIEHLLEDLPANAPRPS